MEIAYPSFARIGEYGQDCFGRGFENLARLGYSFPRALVSDSRCACVDAEIPVPCVLSAGDFWATGEVHSLFARVRSSCSVSHQQYHCLAWWGAFMSMPSLTLTKEQYRELLLNAMIGVHIRGALADDRGEDFKKIEAREQFLCARAELFDSEDLVEAFHGEIIPSEALEEMAHTIIDDYEDDAFWERLETDLGKRDFFRTMTAEEREKMEQEQWLPDRVQEIYDRYAEEFEKNGIENLEIVRRLDVGGSSKI